ncbi:lamin tail domain-containing protein, partial [Patescibacteria group bacterium]|nr:lamin tail domain-containing protein [Patescibacteria group bacterium]
IVYGTSALAAPDTDESIARASLPSGDWMITTTPTTNADNNITVPTASTSPTTKSSSQTQTRAYAVGRILVNEIFPGDTQTAWIELANPESHTLSLDGWKLLINTDAPIPLAGTLAENGHVVIDHLQSGLEGTRGIALLVDPEGYTSEEVLWGSADATTENNAPATTQPETSIARLFDAFSSGNAGADFVETTTPTPKEQNAITAARNTTSPLFFSEILPDPAGPDGTAEFIEIENRSTSTVSTAGWHVAIGNRRPQALPTKDIAPQTVYAFFRSETHLALPNAGADLTLFGPDGRVADTLHYTAADSGVAFAQQSSAWAWTTTPTPDLPNTILKPNHPPHPIIQVTDPETPGEPFLFEAGDAWDEDGPLTSVLWDMGDGTTSTATSTAHSFAAAGRHRVKLTVSDEAGVTASAERSVTVAKNDLEDALVVVAADDDTDPPKPRVLGAKTTKKVAKKTTVKKTAPPIEHIQGTLVVEPGILGVRMVALRTTSGSLLLEVPKQHTDLQRGDVLTATGTEKQRSGKTFFSATAITIVRGSIPEPTTFANLEEVESLSPHSLVRIQGTVLEHRASRLTVGNQGEISIVLPKGFPSRAGTLTEAEVSVTGIVRPIAAGGVEIVARDTKDVTILSAPPPVEKKKEETPFSPASAGITGAVGGILMTSGWSASAALRRRALAALTQQRKSLIG